jgi:hypothetical protein
MRFVDLLNAWLHMIRVLIPILAGCALLGSVVSSAITLAFVAKARPTTATITASETKESESGEALHRPTFVFTVSGRDYSITPRSYVAPSPGDVGDQVPVLYDPRNPQRARIDSFVYKWAVPVVLFVIAIVFGSLHFAIAYVRRLFGAPASSGG